MIRHDRPTLRSGAPLGNDRSLRQIEFESLHNVSPREPLQLPVVTRCDRSRASLV